jgi:membrane-associated phospholipid phosphatase
MAFDQRLASESQERRSASTDRLSRLTTGLGAGDAWAISGGLLATGLVFGDRRLTTMGREAIEASLFAGVIANVVKPAFGRERPLLSNNEAVFKPGTSNYSFPSGHATEAFAVASVVAIRSSGWVVPTLAYTCASLVAFDRVNDRAHFPSDVLAGAALGVAVGRFIAHRHDRLEETGTPRLTLSLEPIPHGLGLRARF